MADLILLPYRASDATFDLVTDATASFFEAGTSTPLTVYTDNGLGTPHGTTLDADAEGVFAQAWVAAGRGVKVDIKDGAGTSLPGFPQDNFPTIAETDLAASNTAFTPVTGNGATDVQTAIANNTSRVNVLDNSTRVVTSTGSSGAFAITSENAISAYAEGQVYDFIANQASVGSGSDTLNVDTVGAVVLKKYEGSTSKTDLAAGDIAIGDKVRVKHDGTHFVVLSPLTAGEGTKGIAEIATAAEITAGTAGKLLDAAGYLGSLANTGLVSVQAFTTSGTWNRPSGVGKVLIFVTGGGHEGGASDYGGAGGTAIKLLDVTSIASSTITIGAGTGVNSSWADGTNTITGTGGTNGSGGVPTGGDLNITGGSGDTSGSGTGAGGASFWGGGRSATNSPVAYGGGGYNGNNGGGGVVFVLEFS